MLGTLNRSLSLRSVKHPRLQSSGRSQLATRCRSLSAVEQAASQPQTLTKKSREQQEQQVSVQAFTEDVKQCLKERGFADDSICESVENALKDKDFDEAQRKRITSNIRSLGFLFSQPDDVKYMVRQQPMLIAANLIMWSGLLREINIDLLHMMHVDPNLVVESDVDDCVINVEYMRNFVPDKKQLGAVIKKTPRLLTVQPDTMQAAEDALKELGLTSCTLSLILKERLEVYYEYSRRPQPYVAEVKKAVELLNQYSLDPNAILPVIPSFLVRKDCSKRLQERLRAFEKLGFSKEEVTQVVGTVPDVLALSPADLQRKWSYAQVVLRNGKKELLDYPQFLLANVPRDIKPAFAYLTHINEQHRVTGGPKVSLDQGKVSLELLVKEAEKLENDPKYIFFREDYRRQQRVAR